MKKPLLTAASLAAFASPVHAEVKSTSDAGFNIVHIAEVSATPDTVWKRLLAPKDWWNKAHSWSGSSDGFYIDAQANGCFCELFQEKGKDGKVLRMQGALGPLQSEAVIGTLTVAMEPVKDGKATKLSFSYVVGGYMRYKVAEIAPAVDKVLGEQFKNLTAPYASTTTGDKTSDGFSLDVDKIEEPAAEPVAKQPPAEPQ
jgi:hypothetical protein